MSINRGKSVIETSNFYNLNVLIGLEPFSIFSMFVSMVGYVVTLSMAKKEVKRDGEQYYSVLIIYHLSLSSM